ncbi:MAG: ACP S-malonyltransferase [Lachnospiraceae bacterium]|nr:ACP S-malonyltransferase [Lachnospiraceae bacterium]
MSKTAFLFAGQGAQYVGMGKDLYENSAKCREIFDKASASSGLDLKKICFEGPAEDLNTTENTQPAVVTVTLALLELVKEAGIKPDVVAGLSLGEYSALTAAGVFDVETVTALVRKRGRYMQEAVPVGVGKMAALLGGKPENVEALCKEASSEGYIAAANFNCPGQIVVGGEAAAVDKAMSMTKEFGILKAVSLPVSAPFHTKMLEPASVKLAAELENISLGKPQLPVICNINGDYLREDADIKDILRKQVMNSVLWEQTVRKMIEDGVDTFIEIGPGATLTGFVKKIDRTVSTYHVENLETLEQLKEQLG